MILQWLEAVGGGLLMFAIIGFVTWLSFSSRPSQRSLHARTVRLRENARRVHEEQQRLREQQQRPYP